MRLAILYLIVIIILSFCLQAKPYEGQEEGYFMTKQDEVIREMQGW